MFRVDEVLVVFAMQGFIHGDAAGRGDGCGGHDGRRGEHAVLGRAVSACGEWPRDEVLSPVCGVADVAVRGGRVARACDNFL